MEKHMSYEEEFDNIVRVNFGSMSKTCQGVEEAVLQRNWHGFAHEWLSKCNVPEEGACKPDNWQECVNYHLRSDLPRIIDWVIADGIADELADHWEFDREFIPSLAELLWVRIQNSYCPMSGMSCDGTVHQQALSLLDTSRLAMAFAEAYDESMGA